MEEMKHETDTRQIRDDNVQVAGTINPGQSGNVYATNGVAPTICASEGVKCNTKIIEQIGREFNKGGKHDICPTISANSFECNNFVLEEILKDVRKKYPNRGIFLHEGSKIYFIRKLTPRECFRLMGVAEPDIDTLLNAGISNSQLYKLAGNSIVVNTLAAIFRQLLIGNFNKVVQTEIF